MISSITSGASSGDVRIPRFLLNDLTRYWRTVTVDFVYKQRAESDRKWALRNAKLRMSRKLVFATGLPLAIFDHYDRFLAILDDVEKRSKLEEARTHEDLRTSAVWNEVREVSGPFHDGLVALFLRDDEPLRTLTMKYGVF